MTGQPDPIKEIQGWIRFRLRSADPSILMLLAHWRRWRGDRIMPDRQDFDPAAVPRMLKHIAIQQFDPEKDDLRFVLAGEVLNEYWGCSLRGLFLSEILPPESFPISLQRWKDLLQVPLVQYAYVEKTGPDGERVRVAERLALPFATPGVGPNLVMTYGLLPDDQPTPARSMPVFESFIRFRTDTI